MNRDAYYDESVPKIKLQEDKPSFVIRSLQINEASLLRDFLYEAIFVPEGMNAPPRNVVDLPELQVYIQVLGAVWVRLMNDYGHVDDQTPSLVISLYAAYRGKGIGTELLRAMLSLLYSEGYKKVSLSVQKANPAARLYERLGFKTVRETDEEYVMVCFTSQP